MKLAYFDWPSGAAGDMILGALVDAGCPLRLLQAELVKVDLHGYDLTASEVRRSGLRGTKVEGGVAPDGHPHRRLPEILALIEKSGLSPRVKGEGARIFRRLAEAEGRGPRAPPGPGGGHAAGG